LRDGAAERAWWRAMLQKRSALCEGAGSDPGDRAIGRMLSCLRESQRREDEIFARQVAEGGN
jgi:hypothetical protein